MTNTAQQVRVSYQENEDVWMVGVGHQTDGTARHWEIDEWVGDGFDGYSAGREAADELAQKVASERVLDVLPIYNPVGDL